MSQMRETEPTAPLECAICCSSLDLAEATGCSGQHGQRQHYFHRGCVQQWVDTCVAQARLPKCPTCRGDLQMHSNIALLVQQLSDSNWRRRTDALTAIVKEARQGNQYAMLAIGERLKHDDWQVRQMLLEDLAMVTQRGDDHVVRLVIVSLKDRSRYVRLECVQLLQSIAKKGDELTSKALTALLQVGEPDLDVKCSALDALANVALRHDPCAISAVTACLNDKFACVTHSAQNALAKLQANGATDACVLQ